MYWATYCIHYTYWEGSQNNNAQPDATIPSKPTVPPLTGGFTIFMDFLAGCQDNTRFGFPTWPRLQISK